MSKQIPIGVLSAIITKTSITTKSKSVRFPIELLSDLEELANEKQLSAHAYILSVLANHVIEVKYTDTDNINERNQEK